MSKLSHVDEQGRATMVDVSAKATTAREAIAKGSIYMAAATLRMIKARKAKKGDVLAVAQLAGIQATKRTADIIPLCHPIALSSVKVALSCDSKAKAAIDPGDQGIFSPQDI